VGRHLTQRCRLAYRDCHFIKGNENKEELLGKLGIIGDNPRTAVWIIGGPLGRKGQKRKIDKTWGHFFLVCDYPSRIRTKFQGREREPGGRVEKSNQRRIDKAAEWEKTSAQGQCTGQWKRINRLP